MRKQINVEVNTSRNEITNGFNITYRGRDPKTTQAVAAELASKYIDEQTKGTVNAGTSAKQFIEEQVRHSQRRTGRNRHSAAHLPAAEHEQPAVAITGAGRPA